MGKKRLNKVISNSLKIELNSSADGTDSATVGVSTVLCNFDGKACERVVNGFCRCVEGAKLDGSDMVLCSRVPSNWVSANGKAF
jgi:hypothetical protein